MSTNNSLTSGEEQTMEQPRRGVIRGRHFAPKVVTYSPVAGEALFEGDISLGKVDEPLVVEAPLADHFLKLGACQLQRPEPKVEARDHEFGVAFPVEIRHAGSRKRASRPRR